MARQRPAAHPSRQHPHADGREHVVAVAGFVWNGVINFHVTDLVAGHGLAEATGRDHLTHPFAAGVPAFLIADWLADWVRFVPFLLGVDGGFGTSPIGLTLAEGLLAVGLGVLFVLGRLPAGGRAA